MGFSIALTGLVLFIFGFLVGAIGINPPIQTGFCIFGRWTMIAGGLSIPIGLIIQIWQ